MAKSETPSQSGSPLDKPGFHLLKQGKELVIAGKRFIRLKDVTIKKGDKEHVEKNIKNISYVPNSLIKSNKIDLKHFEPGPVDEIPVIKHENIKTMQARFNKPADKLDDKPADKVTK